MSATLWLEIHHHGAWHQAGEVAITAPHLGISGPSATEYAAPYWLQWGADDPSAQAALSLGLPVSLDRTHLSTWPAFMLDLMPQGPARRRLAAEAGFANPDRPAAELDLLLAGAGSPIGNIRVAQAHARQAESLQDRQPEGLTTADVLNQTDRFLAMLDQFPAACAGAQGEWPKALLTQRRTDGFWYPDAAVANDDAKAFVLVKLLRSRAAEDRVILESEPAYPEMARSFGLRVGALIRAGLDLIAIPRFDRARDATGLTIRYGQESLVSAAGVARFGFEGSHEQYVQVLGEHASDPVTEIREYVLRDLLNLAMGNPDNHGRNSALQKRREWVGLTPLFDFTPARLAPDPGPRMTRWACLGRGDSNPDWRTVCGVAAGDLFDPRLLEVELLARLPLLHALPDDAKRFGLAPDVISRAFAALPDLIAGVEALRHRTSSEPAYLPSDWRKS